MSLFFFSTSTSKSVSYIRKLVKTLNLSRICLRCRHGVFKPSLFIGDFPIFIYILYVTLLLKTIFSSFSWISIFFLTKRRELARDGLYYNIEITYILINLKPHTKFVRLCTRNIHWTLRRWKTHGRNRDSNLFLWSNIIINNWSNIIFFLSLSVNSKIFRLYTWILRNTIAERSQSPPILAK